MTNPSDHEARTSRSETRMEQVAAGATAARHRAAAHDRDVADLGVTADAHRTAVSAPGIRTAERLTRPEKRVGVLERRGEEGVAQMRPGVDRTAAGVARIATLIGGLGGRGE